jgi:hypothetical protein
VKKSESVFDDASKMERLWGGNETNKANMGLQRSTAVRRQGVALRVGSNGSCIREHR